MRRIAIPFLLVAGVLALATAGLADPGGKGKAKGGHNRYSAQIVVDDHGTCGNKWAKDTSNRTWTVKKSQNGTFRVTRKDKGTFVTMAGKSPGACDTTGKHGSLVNAGIKGKFRGYLPPERLRGTVGEGAIVHSAANVYWPGWTEITVQHRDAVKGAAIPALLDVCGSAGADVVACGDHLNDQPPSPVGCFQQATVGRWCPGDAWDDRAERLGDERHR